MGSHPAQTEEAGVVMDSQPMIYCFDIDNTICTTDGTDYENARPKWPEIKKIRALKEAGNIIKFHTARGTVSGIDYRALTERQLNQWGVPFDELTFGKPNADRYIDNKGIAAQEWARKQVIQIYGAAPACLKCGCKSAVVIVNIMGLEPHLVRIGRGNTKSAEQMVTDVAALYVKLGWVVDSPAFPRTGNLAIRQQFTSKCSVCDGQIPTEIQTDSETMRVVGLVFQQEAAQ